jgi:oxygen-independent coproporphyrinogen-3 oxidase
MTFGIYIQVPFCQTKCTYCNFHTGVVSPSRYPSYAEAVCREIAEFERLPSRSAPGTPEAIDTVYFGGGTPSLLDPAALAKILDALRARFRWYAGEVTLEADPETITAEKADAWARAGFNRISLGAQSFNDQELQAAGRMHRAADISRAVNILRAAGLTNISIDLIAGLAHQTRESWEESVTELLRLRPEHASVYLLEIDEGSRLGRESLAGGSRYGAPAVPSDDAMADSYGSVCARLKGAGYEHYEISNWALSGRRSRHNLKYWRREPYLGFGAGAHSFAHSENGPTRWANIHDSARYVAMAEQGLSPREQIEAVSAEQAFDEELFLGLRQLDGIDMPAIEQKYGNALAGRFADTRRRIDDLRANGLVEFDGARLRLAPDRIAISNEVFVELLG